MEVTIVDSEPSVVALIDNLDHLPTEPPSLYLDIEGVNLSRHGSISILQLFILRKNHVFLIDIFVLQEKAFCTSNGSGTDLRSILESALVPKVFFDVRNDSDALFAHFRISMQGTNDVQLLEVATRSYSKERVNGLAKCIEADAQLSLEASATWKATKQKGVSLFAPEHGGSYEVFNSRPMLQDIIDYCTQDVVYLPILWNIYTQKISAGWMRKVQSKTCERIRESQTASYEPHSRKKSLSPWANPAKSGQVKRLGNTGVKGPGRMTTTPVAQVATADAATRLTDIGKDNYAGQFFYNIPATAPQISVAWASNWEYAQLVPTGTLEDFRSFTTVPRLNVLANTTRSECTLLSYPYPYSSLYTTPTSLANSTTLTNTSILYEAAKKLEGTRPDAKQQYQPSTGDADLQQSKNIAALEAAQKTPQITAELERPLSEVEIPFRSKNELGGVSHKNKAPTLYRATVHPKWTCKICRREMQEDQKEVHLAGKQHKLKALLGKWTCVTCSREMQEDKRQEHLTGKKHIARAKRAATAASRETGTAKEKTLEATTVTTRNPKAKTRQTNPNRAEDTGTNSRKKQAAVPKPRQRGLPYPPDHIFSGFGGSVVPRNLQHETAFSVEDMDFGLCDKDCVWCGHCMDGVDI